MRTINQKPANFDLLKRAIERVTIPRLWMHFSLPGRIAPSCNVRCPWREDKHPSFSVFAEGRRWKDHGSNEAGDSFHFYCRITGLSPKQAYRSFIVLAGLETELRKRGVSK
jgi:CHC2 zinc finger